MVLAIDIGNTNVVIGGFQEQQILFVERVSTNQNATSLELAISIKTILEIYQIQTTEIEGCIISSVVPSINHAVRKAVEKIAHCPVVLVGPGVKTGLQIAIDNPAQLGADLVCVSVAALEKYPLPSIVIDMGTATTISAMDRHGKMLEQSVAGCFRRFQFQIDKGIFLRMLILEAQVFQLCLDGEKPQTVC